MGESAELPHIEGQGSARLKDLHLSDKATLRAVKGPLSLSSTAKKNL